MQPSVQPSRAPGDAPLDRAGARAIQAALEQVRPVGAGLGFSTTSRWDVDSAPQYPVEYRLANRLVGERRKEFLVGRRAMRRALAGIGVTAGALPYDGPRPRLPAGTVGSISHSRGVAVAVAGVGQRFRGAGIDVEFTALPLQSAHLVLGPAELAWWRLARDEILAGQLLLDAFSAKEAAFKAVDALLPLSPRLRDIRLRPVRGGFTAAVPTGCPAEPADGTAGAALDVAVAVRRLPGGVLTWALIPALRHVPALRHGTVEPGRPAAELEATRAR